jgi:predicted CopG family antitoxin
MATTKEEIMNLVKKMPEEVSVDDVMEELYFRKKVDVGLEQLDQGEGIAHEDVKKRHSKWLDK